MDNGNKMNYYILKGDEGMIGDNIRKLRLEREWTQGELADRLGVSRSALGNYERELREPGIDLLIKLADTFNTTIDALVGRK